MSRYEPRDAIRGKEDLQRDVPARETRDTSRTSDLRAAEHRTAHGSPYRLRASRPHGPARNTLPPRHERSQFSRLAKDRARALIRAHAEVIDLRRGSAHSGPWELERGAELRAQLDVLQRDKTLLPRRLRELPREVTLQEAAILRDVGRFRLVKVDSLGVFLQTDDPGARDIGESLDRLRKQGLLHVSQFDGHTDRYVTLTQTGQRLARRLVLPGQPTYSGARKTREARHDAAIYDAYQLMRVQLEKEDFRPTIVRLDYELKRDLRREAWKRAKETAQDQGLDLESVPKLQRLDRIAAASRALAPARELPTTRSGAVQYPDLQIEYEDARDLDGDRAMGRCNIEIVTEHYKTSTLLGKASAGFHLFAVDTTRDSSRAGTPRTPARSLMEELLEL